ncbi:MAG TPA: DUF3467 domain-containing protein [bacterium]
MNEKKELSIQIQLDETTAQGAYSNLAFVNHSETEFTMDFIYLQPQEPKGKVRARIITSPQHMKRFFLAIQENLRKYEAKFGEVKVSPPQFQGKIDFLQ